MDPVKFLLVDDLSENLLSLEALLRREGLMLLKAQSGDQALELLLDHDVALALIDVQMPGLNGFELAELMRGNERTRRVPIIFVTAGTTDGQRRFHGYEAGAVDFIQKPIEADVLRSKADVFFELYRQRQQIAAQRDELEMQAKALQQADRRKDEFLATLAHELRNPLAPLRHGLDLLRMNPDSKSAGEVKEMMDRQLVHLVRLIDDLLDVSRVSQGKIELRRNKIRIDEVFRSAIEASRPTIDAASHSFASHVPDEPIWIEADETRISQVVSNLLNNAAKYTPPGGRIVLSARNLENEVVIDVEDNGVGIPPEKRGDVFRLFSQIDDHLQRAQGGLGIGLALVQQLVTMHGGSVESTAPLTGTGSVFKVRLPLAAAPEEPRHESSSGVASFARRPLKVLVIDDNEDVAFTLALMLEELGHEYHLVHDGRKALSEAQGYGPDVVLLDIGLPGMDGYEVCKAFREAGLIDLPIIAQTGWGQAEDKQKSVEAGFNFHLTKPVPLDELERTLAAATGLPKAH
ncbi:response regulator [Rhizobium sp. S163]|uniref:response regulator n=1 Tax=Rhizobium sp. S163 TaxID=3055039 RepID=UPI0025AA1A72|nr:response regulator [Rhizobium sp. S163]MDM9644800.1 response regulator [Rhizobium sp. S163]